MGSNFGTSEIVESNEGPNLDHKILVDARAGKHPLPTSEPYSLDDDLSQLIKTFQLRTPPRGSVGPVRGSKQLGVSSLQKNAIKRPSRVGASQLSGIGISETVTLKQALRGLCISQASEMAAMKRLSRSAGCSGSSDAGAIKRLYGAVVVKAGETGGSLQEKGSLFEISLVPEKDSSSLYENTGSLKENQINEEECLSEASIVMEKATLNSSEARLSKLPKVKPSGQNVESSPHCSVPTALKDMKIEAPSPDVNSPAKSDDGCKTLTVGTRLKGKIALISISNSGSEVNNSDAGLSVMKPIRNTQKGNKNPTSASDTTNSSSYLDRASVGSDTCRLDCQKDSNHKNVGSETSSTNDNIEVSSIDKKSITNVPCSCSGSCHEDSIVSGQMNGSMRTKEKEVSYPSSKSSIGDNSSGTSISDESNLSSNAGSGSRPHMSKDWRWEAIRHVEMQHGSIGFGHFKLLKRLGSGDIGTVYLAELLDTSCPFALKIMDIDFLARRRKTLRAQTEREILQMLDHPFLPTLYTHFMTDKLSCFVMEYCPGGDLHVLRQTQPGRCFSEQAARFYVAEVLLALEYLHMLGVVYRDLKPENVLVREDGHIMLSDFDLSLRCVVNPTLLKSSSQSVVPGKRSMHPCAASPCIDPLCLQPAWVQVPCFTPRLVSAATRTGKSKSKPASQARPLPQLVAEPTDARSNSFVGTHEYLAPEIIKGEGHGSAVDWWTFGIFLYELLFGRTPFKGLGNEDTLANAVLQSLEFPDTPAVSFHARDLIGRLLVKEPENRLGSVRGSAEIKQHPFFEGLNWALIRCAVPPEIPSFDDYGTLGMPSQRKQDKCLEVKITKEHLEFELF